MKRLLIPLACAAGLALAGCTTIEGWFGSAAGPTSAPVANSIQGAGNLVHAAAPVVSAYVKTANCNTACRDMVAKYNHEVRLDLDAGLDAEAKGDNAAVAVALQEFNTHYGYLWTFMAAGGAPLPSP